MSAPCQRGSILLSLQSPALPGIGVSVSAPRQHRDQFRALRSARLTALDPPAPPPLSVPRPSPSSFRRHSLTNAHRASANRYHPPRSARAHPQRWGLRNGASEQGGSQQRAGEQGAGERSSSLRARVAPRHAAEEAGAHPSRAAGSVDVLITGAGVAGLAAALALHRIGIHVAVVERAPALSQSGAALSLWGNAWRALDALGVAGLLRPEYVRLEGIDITAADGSSLRSFNFADCNVGPEHEVRGVTRAHLLSCMAAQLPPGTIRFATTVTHIAERSISDGSSSQANTAASPLTVTLSDGSTIEAKALIGCDGDTSAVASWLGLPATNYSGYRAARGVAELDSPDSAFTVHGSSDAESADVAGGVEGRGKGRVRMVWGRGVRAGMYPLTPTQVYWFTCYNAPPSPLPPKASEAARAEALSHVQGWQGGIERLIHATPLAGISVQPITDRWSLPPPLGTWGRGAVSLAGDAAHPMTPNLGQGACTALEDAVVLARCIWGASVVDESERGESEGEEGEGSVSVRRRVESVRVCDALREYEGLRGGRVAQLTVRSFAIGWLLQLSRDVVCYTRDRVVLPHLFSPSHFLDHALFDCGSLPDNDA